MKQFRHIWQVLLSLCLMLQIGVTYAAVDLSPLQKVDALIQEKLPNTSIGIVLQDAKTGKVLYERRANENFLPASTTKLISSSAALFALGPDYHFETAAKIDPANLKEGVLTGDLFIQFTGDPSLTTDNLRELIKEVKAFGIKEIVGDIVIDNTRFQGPNYAMGWAWNSLPWAFSAPVTSIILNENRVNLLLTPNKTLGEKAVLAVAPEETTKVDIIHDIVSVSESEANERCQIMLDINSQNEVTAYGCWPAKETADTLKVALQNPVILARGIIADTLKAESIKLTGQIALGTPHKTLKTIAFHHSKPLSELLKTVLQESNNIYADSLLKTIGVAQNQQGSFQTGVLATLDVLNKNLGLETAHIRLKDGSGLSRYNAVSPNYFARLLFGMYHSKAYSKIFRESLAVSGMLGTLKNRVIAPDLGGQVQAKTGSMIGTSSLAGYLTSRNKEELIFVIMINNALADQKEIMSLENSLCEIFASI